MARGRPAGSLLLPRLVVYILLGCGKFAAPSSISRSGAGAAPVRDGDPANFTLAVMWNFPIDAERSRFIGALYHRFFRKVVHIGGDDKCNRWNGGRDAIRIEHYSCYGKLMARHPDAFATQGFLFVADDAVICPLEILGILSAEPGVPRLANETIRGPISWDGAVPPAVRLDHVRHPPADHIPDGLGLGEWTAMDEERRRDERRKAWSANGTGCVDHGGHGDRGQRPRAPHAGEQKSGRQDNCWWRWWWSREFPNVRDTLYASDAVLTAELKRRSAARLGDKCPVNTVFCMPAPALSDVLYVPAGPNAVAFARHAAAITKVHITTEIATPIIMHLLPVAPQPFPVPGRFYGLTGPDRANALRLLDPASTASAQYGDTRWGKAGSQWDPRFQIPAPNEHGCSFVWLHPLKLSYEVNQQALARFLNRQHERMRI